MLKQTKKNIGEKMKTNTKAIDLHAMEIILIRNFMELSVLDCKVYARKYLEAFGAVAVSDLVNFYNKNIDRDKEETLAMIGHDINLLHSYKPELAVPRTLK